MNTPTRMHRSSALSLGMTPLATESTTARATAACAGPNIWTACLAPLMVTLLKSRVSGLAGRFGATTASRLVKPSLLLLSEFANATPAGPDFDPMMRSIWATSLPSPTSDSPRKKSAAMWIYSCSESDAFVRWNRGRLAVRTVGGGRCGLSMEVGADFRWRLVRTFDGGWYGLSTEVGTDFRPRLVRTIDGGWWFSGGEQAASRRNQPPKDRPVP